MPRAVVASPRKPGELPRGRKLMMPRHVSSQVDVGALSNTAADERNQESEAVNDLSEDDQDQPQEPATPHRQRFKDSSTYALSLALRVKYGLPDGDQNSAPVRDRQEGEHDKVHMEHYSTDECDEIGLTQHGHQIKDPVNDRLPLHFKNSCLTTHHVDDNQHIRQIQLDADDDCVSNHKAAIALHYSKKDRRIAESTLQAAQAQAAELRALHSAAVNHLGRGADVQNGDVIMPQELLPTNEHLAQYKSRPNRKKWKIHNNNISGGGKQVEAKLELDAQGGAPPSGASSASSTADCFIRPVQEYPIFRPHSQSDILISAPRVVDDVNSMNRRTSVDAYESVMVREELLHYIFDHDNKRNFSRSQFNGHARGDISCLHASLDLAPHSGSSLLCLQNDEDDDDGDDDRHGMHHLSLNLPQGSQHQLFKANTPKLPFEDHSVHTDKKLYARHHHHRDGSTSSPSFKKSSDDVRSKPVKGKDADSYIDASEGKAAALQGLTSRQRALFEFLSEEPARMRAFNELADKEAAISSYHIQPPSVAGVKDAAQQKNIQEDVAPASSVKLKLETSRSIDGRNSDIHFSQQRHQRMHEPPLTRDITKMHQRLANALNDSGRLHHTSSGMISWDKCRPTGGFPGPEPSLGESSELSIANPVGNPPNEKTDHHKKPSIKGWFFRGKRKQTHSSTGPPASLPPACSNNPTPVTSGTFAANKEQPQASGNFATSVVHAAPTSHVFSGLASSEAEKELELAMAMDLMELKVLQANTKRDAAMAEVLELRLAMDSMAKKLVEVERHCEGLRTQLMDVQALRKRQEEMKQALGVNHDAIHLVPRMVAGDADLWMQQYRCGTVDADVEDLHDILAAADPGQRINRATDEDEDDFCESDSHDNREERKAAAQMISVVQSSGYSGRSGRTGRGKQPNKEEFLSAVAEARVGVKQMSRVMLQHVEEEMGRDLRVGDKSWEGQIAGTGAESGKGGAGAKKEMQRWGPVVMMCREARRGTVGTGSISTSSSSGSTREVVYCVEALISMAFYEHFENVGFDKNGAHKILEPAQRALSFYHSYLKISKLPATQLLTHSSSLYDAAFDRFCSRKMRTIGRTVGCPGRHWPDDLTREFLRAARAVWLLHKLAFVHPTHPPGIFRVAAQCPFDPRFMELLPMDHRKVHASTHLNLLVSLMVMPGFFLYDDVIKCKVLAA